METIYLFQSGCSGGGTVLLPSRNSHRSGNRIDESEMRFSLVPLPPHRDRAQDEEQNTPMNEARATPRQEKQPICLTIAGFDPSSGAGVTADLKTFAAHGLYGVAATSALTVQSTTGVRAVEPVRPGLLRDTLDCLAEDLPIAGVKIGMLATAGLVYEVERFLKTRPELRGTTVLDPVCRSSSGAPLLDEAGTRALREQLLGAVGWVTPNLDELTLLVDSPELRNEGMHEHVPELAAQLAGIAAALSNPELGIVVTGGHLDPSVGRPDDYVLLHGQGTWIPGEWVETTSTHGTGCAFSSALLSALVRGRQGVEAVRSAKDYVADALRASQPMGRGHGPLHHLFALERVRK
jgi:hydroxymethylpyrimidine/phosphomethylpyrimidine kinase